MHSSTLLLVCVLATCSVWTVSGARLKVDTDDQEQVVEVEASLPGVCWACKWALNKVKKSLSQNATAEKIKSKLLACCSGIGFLKKMCNKFVEKNLSLLIEELSTVDDVRTICVNTKACKKKEMLDLHFLLDVDDNDDFP